MLQPIEQSQRLRVWTPEQSEQEQAGNVISPRMTLSAFFLLWFVPIVLEGHAAEGTRRKFNDAIQWWVRLTGDPPLNLIDEFTVKEFETKLKTATFRRGKLGREYRLAEFTQVDHLKAIDQILYRTGPTYDPKRPTKKLLEAPPRITVDMPSLDEPKEPFAIERARQIVAATADLADSYKRRTQSAKPWRQPARMYALMLALYYTGFRIGTVLQFRWSMLLPRETGMFIKVPKEIVSKTHKGRTKFLHPIACDAIERLPGPRGDALMFAPEVCYTHIVDLHERVQLIAGIPLADCLSPQAWRRTHGEQMGLAGLSVGMKLAMNALDHSDEEITREFYVKIEPELILRLPAIAEAPIDARQRKLF